MTGIEPRFYRKQMGEGRFRAFTVGYKDSDLWIGVDPGSYNPAMVNDAQQHLFELRKTLEAYLLIQPDFATTFIPIQLKDDAPAIAQKMAEAARKAGTGPMAAVAGAFAEAIAQELIKKFEVEEIVVENGGDLFLLLKNKLILSVYAGKSSLSGKIGIEVPASITPVGICTSAGTVGPSVSFGKADAVMLASRNCALADALATAIGNQIKTAADLNQVLEKYASHREIISLLAICEGSMGIRGQLALKAIR